MSSNVTTYQWHREVDHRKYDHSRFGGNDFADGIHRGVDDIIPEWLAHPGVFFGEGSAEKEAQEPVPPFSRHERVRKGHRHAAMRSKLRQGRSERLKKIPAERR
jgi:hypothetical protein